MSISVFVTDGSERPALAIVRALGSRGVTVIVGSDETVSLASSSRYCARHVAYPSPYRDPAAFERFLLDFVAREPVDVLLPVSDVTTRIVCAHQDVIRRNAAVAVPTLDAFERVCDKQVLLDLAVRNGVPIPRTICVERLAALPGVLKDVRYPAVIKPTRSRISSEGGWIRATVHYAESESALVRLYREVPYLSSSPSLIQQRIVGPGLGVFMLFDCGRLVCEFGHRRLREKPPAGGVSVLRESTPVDPCLREYAIRVFSGLGWHGVAMMEFKQDAQTGALYLMEVNGRFWGSLQLAIDAGLDFPWLVSQLALGRSTQSGAPYRVGVKSRWLLGDLDHLYLRLFKSNHELQLPSSSPSRLRAVVDFLKFRQPGMRYEIARFDDFRPFLHELRLAGRDVVPVSRRIRRRPGGRAAVEVCDSIAGHVQ
jgi:predicted ATP-grasp superfamily ATP-dependent carboligase